MNNNPCFNCGYMYADCDATGIPITSEYCHFEGPKEWAPCAQDEYEEAYDYDYYEEEIRYQEYLESLNEEELEVDYEVGYEQPYDYREFQ